MKVTLSICLILMVKTITLYSYIVHNFFLSIEPWSYFVDFSRKQPPLVSDHYSFHMKGFALGLVLKQRQRATRKWPILHQGQQQPKERYS